MVLPLRPLRSSTRALAVFATTAVLLQWAWEVAHGPAYVETALPLVDRVWHCAPMAFVDAVWTGVLVVTARIVSARIGWSTRRVVALTSAALGALTGIAFEMWAIDRGRWTYNESMPLLPLVGAGLWPVLQMSIVPPAVYLMSVLAANRTGNARTQEASRP